MSATVVALVTVNEDEPQALAAYLDATTPLLERVGAKIRQRFTLTEVVVGEPTPQTMIVVEYPSKDAVFEVFRSDVYRDIIPVRDQAFSTYSVSVVGNEMDLAHAME